MVPQLLVVPLRHVEWARLVVHFVLGLAALSGDDALCDAAVHAPVSGGESEIVLAVV